METANSVASKLEDPRREERHQAQREDRPGPRSQVPVGPERAGPPADHPNPLLHGAGGNEGAAELVRPAEQSAGDQN